MTRLPIGLTACFAALALLAGITPNANAQFDRAAKWIPAGANSIVLVREKDILESRLAQKNGWMSEATRAFETNASLLPPSTERLLIAAEIDFEFAEPVWQVTVFENSEPTLDIVNVSKRLEGSIENISGREALVLPGDAYLVKIDDKMLVARYPANRQMTSRWIRSRKSLTNNLPEYLNQAINYAENNAHIMVAFDLQDIVSAEDIRQRINNLPVFGADSKQLDECAKCLASVKGMQFGVTITDKINGAIKIDFNEKTDAIAKYAKQILILALQDRGLMMEDLRNWKLSVSEKQVTFKGELSEQGFRQLNSFIEQPLIMDYASEYDEDEGPDMKTRTVQYFRAIQEVVDSMRGLDAKALSTHARWLDRFSFQIDKLPVLNVDPEALKYGRYVSDTFREMAGGMLDVNTQGMAARVSVPDEAADPGINYYYGRYRNDYYLNSYKLRNQNRATNRARALGMNRAKKMMDEIDAASIKIRQEMTKKYKIEF